MFRVVKLEGEFNLHFEVDFIVAVEYIEKENITMLYCFTRNSLSIKRFYELIKQKSSAYLLPQTYHDAYLKNYYYDLDIIISPNITPIRLFNNYHFINNLNFIFLETKNKRKRIKEKIIFATVDELKTILIDNYGLKYVVPFYYSIREMKEFMPEKRVKVEDLTLIYLVENKTLEGKKR